MRARVTAAVAALLLAPAGATASTASVSSSTLTIIAEGPEVNAITVTAGEVEDRAGITAGEGCVQRTPTLVACERFAEVFANLDGGADSFASAVGVGITVDGGSGPDTVRTGTGRDRLLGAAGNDTLEGGDADDELAGGEGDDTLAGGPGNDTIEGGAGNDSVRGDDGDDTVAAGDAEADQLDCGAGGDTATADADDGRAACETVTEVAIPFTVRIFAGNRLTTRWLLIRGYGGNLEVSHPGTLRLELAVGRAEARRTGLGDRRVVIADHRTRLGHPGTHTFDLLVKQRYRARVEKLRRLRATAIFVVVNERGEVRRVTRPLRVVND